MFSFGSCGVYPQLLFAALLGTVATLLGTVTTLITFDNFFDCTRKNP